MIVALICTGKSNLAKSRTYLFCMLLFLGAFVGLSDMLGGYDRYLYAELFDTIADYRTAGLGLPPGFYLSEQGYMMINYAISFITSNRYIFILIFTLIIYLLIYICFSEYAENYPIAIVMFMAMMFFFTFTYLRQVLAVMVAWLSIRFIYRRRLPQFLLCVLLAISIHNSAVVFLPMYFVPTVKFNKNIVSIVMLCLLLIGLTPFPGALFSSFGEMSGTDSRIIQYTHDYESITGGFRLAYIIEAVFFLYIILRNYNLLSNEKKNIVLQNMSIVFCGILLLFVRSSTGGRLSWYYMIGIIATITYILVHTRMPNLRRYMNIVCFLLYFRIVFAWGIFLSPYKTFLTNGYREGDPVHMRYEYDHRYDVDKFYR